MVAFLPPCYVEVVVREGGPSLVDLIQESSWDVVLSDLWTAAREPAGDLLQTLEGLGKENRAGLGALRTRPLLAKGKFFTSSAALSAKLFTAGAAAEEGFAAALLPRQ